MDTIICPKCGTENPINALNCTHCRINLQFAFEHPDQIKSAKFEVPQLKNDSTQQAIVKRTTNAIIFAVFLLLVCFVLWVVSSLLLSPPVFGPCAYGEVHHDTFLTIVQYWPLHLVLGYFIVVARAFVGTQPQDSGTVRWDKFLTITIVVWIVAAVLLWFLIFQWLCA